MKTLESIIASPSAFDSFDNYMGETSFPDLDVVLTRNRDSDILAESNWACALERLGGESDDVVIHRFGHWACGWWEALCVKRGTEAHKIGQDIVDSLADYPVLNEEDWAQRESEEADRIWNDCYRPLERVEYIREHRKEFDFCGFADLIAQVRGKYFGGYASELID